MKYRREVDGIRAIAVVSVVLYHAHLPFLTGGFVGVDVFFVISGYLITSLIHAEMAEGRFSIMRFYQRRARRILPALFLVLLVCLPFAILWLPPLAFKDFSQSLVAVLGFASNIFFWLKTDYFDTGAALKPLLHTWSLAVEEQFYIVFPLLLMALIRAGVVRILPVLAVLALASFGLAVAGAGLWPTANFFLPFSRAWELLAGSMLAMHLGRKGLPEPGLASDGLAGLGLLLMIVPMTLLDDQSPFPSWSALPPVGGAIMMIANAVPGTLVARLLTLRLMVGLGLISYSLYLWHQPVFAFARIRQGGEPSAALYAGLIGLCLVLAILSLRLVETPFRRPGQIGMRRLVLSGTATAAFLGMVGIAGHVTNGAPQRLPQDLAAQLRAASYHRGCLRQDGRWPEADPARGCIFGDGPRTVALIGDSVAASLAPELAKSLGGGVRLVQLSHGHCLPLTGLRKDHRGAEACPRFLAESVETARKLGAERAILVGAWFQSGMGEGTDIMEAASGARLDPAAQEARLGTALASYVAGLGMPATVIAPYFEPTQDLSARAFASYLSHGKILWTETVPRAEMEARRAFWNRVMTISGAELLDPAALFCSGEEAEAICPLVEDGNLVLTDRTHYTPWAAARIAEAIDLAPSAN